MFTMLLCTCSDNDDTVILKDNPELSGTWLLVEQYLDPGDGSGDFKKMDSKKTIQFLEDGMFRSKGKLCNLDTDSGPDISGKYVINDILTKYSSENHLLPEGCDFEDYRVYIHLEGSSLILSYPCFEGCAQKFRKK